MPAKNIKKIYLEMSYYHVYNRGVNKEKVFRDSQDYEVFLSLLKRYLGSTAKRSNRIPYPNYSEKIELLAYCLMPNHFHLFVYQKEIDGMTQLLKSVTTSYSMYFNKKYKRVGPVFQQRYKAVLIADDAQLIHISRYIHLNPNNYYAWKWSSLSYYTSDRHVDWLHPERIIELHGSHHAYQEFLDDYKDRRDELAILKDDLAG